MNRVQLQDLLRIAREEFSDIVTAADILGETRIRLTLREGSSMDVLYPRRDKYSFHWARKNGIVRINTAPHHPGPTYPRHVHLGVEENVLPDDITSLEVEPEENLRRVLGWVRKQLGNKPGKMISL